MLLYLLVVAQNFYFTMSYSEKKGDGLFGGHHNKHHGGHHVDNHMTYPVHANNSYCVPSQPVVINQGYIPPQQYNIPPIAPVYPQGSGYPALGVSYPSQQNAYVPQGSNPSYGVGPPPAYSNMPPSQPMYYTQQQSGAYDAAARFGKGSSYNIPPPPPGVAPNAAQIAAAQGQNVTMQHRSADWVSGPPGGGSTFW